MDNPNKLNQKLSFLKATYIAMEFGFMIAVPLVAFGLFGKWLNNIYEQRIFLPIGIILALATSGLWCYKTIKILLKTMRNEK